VIAVPSATASFDGVNMKSWIFTCTAACAGSPVNPSDAITAAAMNARGIAAPFSERNEVLQATRPLGSSVTVTFDDA
jgi:hypothetical protein